MPTPLNPVYVVVVGNGRVEAMDALLYQHAGRALTVCGERGGSVSFVTIVAVQSEVSRDDSIRLAEGQAERLRSGCYGAKVFTDYHKAKQNFSLYASGYLAKSRG